MVAMTYPPQQNTPQQRSTNRKAIIIIAACVAVVFAAANVWLIIKMASEPDSDPTDTTQSSDDDSGDPADGEDGSDTAPTSPAEVTYDVPKDFEETSASALAYPLFDNRVEHHMILSDSKSYESIFVVSYVLPDDTSDYTEDQLIEQAVGFGETAQRENSQETAIVDSGPPVVISDYIEATIDSGEVKYDTLYYFDGYYMIQVGCQFDKEAEIVGNGCGDVVDSLNW